MSTTISSTGPGYNPAPAGQPESRPAGKMSADDLIGGLEKLHAESVKYLSQFDGAGRSENEASRVGSFGAPKLEAPARVFSVNDIVDLLRSLRSKVQDEMLKTAQEGVRSVGIKLKTGNQESQKLIKEWISKCKSAAKRGTVAKVFSWIGRAVAFVASAVTVLAAGVAAVVTGGAAVPLLAVAVVGFVGASLSLINAISAEKGGPEFSIANLLRNTLGWFLTGACGVDAKKAENITKICGGFLAINMPVALLIEPSLMGDMVQALALEAGTSEKAANALGITASILSAIGVAIAMIVLTAGTSLASSVTQAGSSMLTSGLKIFSSTVSGASAVMTGSTQITTGGLGIAKARLEQKSQIALSNKKELEVQMTKLKKAMDGFMDDIKRIIQDMEEGARLVTQMLASATDSMEQVTKNMSGRSV